MHDAFLMFYFVLRSFATVLLLQSKIISLLVLNPKHMGVTLCRTRNENNHLARDHFSHLTFI